LLSGTCLLRSNEYEKDYSFIDLGDHGCDADVKRSAGIAQPNGCDATNLKAQGNKDAVLSAAKSSANAANDSKQQFPA
jgi:hypothetical protein